jgi:exodeoxyribonuclease I
MFPAERGCLAVMWPLATHPTNKNELLAWDLAHDPSELALLDVGTLRQRLFSKSADLPEGIQRLALKSVHLNKSPMVVRKLKTLTDEMAAKWGVNIEAAMLNAEKARALPDMSAIWPEVFSRPMEVTPDVDEDLYGGFINNADRRRLNQLRALSPAELAHNRAGFDDDRLGELLFRYRARNFCDTLTADEAERWESHRTARLLEGEGGARNVDALLAELDVLSETADERGAVILEALSDYAELIAPELG